MKKDKIGIIVLNYNTPNDVEKCITSIRNTCKMNYKIYLVDNCSTDNSMSYFTDLYKGCGDVSLIASDKNRGFSAGNNIGGTAATKEKMDLLLFTNSDILFKDSSIEEMASVLCNTSYSNVGIVGPKIETPDSESEEFARSKLTLASFVKTKTPFCYFRIKANKKGRYQKIKYDNNNIYPFKGMVSGCCLMMNSRLFSENNGFDEKLFLYGEEDVWAYKLEKLGLDAAICGNASVFHNHHNSIKKKGLAFTRFYQWLSPLIVIREYGTYSKALFNIICLINIVTWDLCSIISSDYRRFNHQFRKKIIQLMKG